MPRSRRPKLLESEVLAAIKGSCGIVSFIAQKLKCTRKTVYRYLDEFPAINEAYVEEREAMLDTAEHALHSLIKGGDLGAICFYLKCQGKRRGYVEKEKQETGVTPLPWSD